MAASCTLEILSTAGSDLADFAEAKKRKLFGKLSLMAGEAPARLDQPAYRAQGGKLFRKQRAGRHRCYLLGGSRECRFRLHTVVLNKNDKWDPHRRQLEAKLAREPRQGAGDLPS